MVDFLAFILAAWLMLLVID